MTAQALLTIGFFVVVLIAAAYPLAIFVTRIADVSPIRGVAGAVERFLYRLSGVDPKQDMSWTRYAVALLLFNALGALVVFALQRLQFWLPLNPQAFVNISSDSSFNTAVSFVTNTNWQGYSGESTMSYFTQMVALAVQNFLSAATGIAVAFALIRGFARRSAQGIGNFWVDVTRSTVYILLPLATIVALFLVARGIPQTFDRAATVTLVQPVTYDNPKNGPDGQPLK